MNALQYYIIDSYIKKQETIPDDGAESEGLVTGRGDAEAANPERRGRRRGGGDGGSSVYSVISGRDEGGSESGSDGDSDGEDDELPKAKTGKGGGAGKSAKGGGVKTKVRETGDDEYDPAVDGDTPTVIGSSSSAVSGLTGSGSINIREEEERKESDSLISHE